MELFLATTLSFPTLFWTLLLGLVVFYWLLSVLGAVDIDLLDIDFDMDADGPDLDAADPGASMHGLTGLLFTCGLHGVPVTIVLSLLIAFSWIICYFVWFFVGGLIPAGTINYLLGAVLMVLVVLPAIPLTASCIKPLRPVFRRLNTAGDKVLLGRRATVRSSRVDESFGEAICVVDGAELLLKIRMRTPNTLSKGTGVVVLEKNTEGDAYWVAVDDE